MAAIRPSDKLSAARLRAVTMAPYFRSGLLSLIPMEAPGLGTLAVTDRWVMLYDPTFVMATDDRELAASIIHELLHCTLNHAARCKAIGANPEMWNEAADAAINDAIGALPLPSFVITPAKLGLPSGLTAEGYYRALEQKRAKQPKQSSGGQGEPKEQGQGQSDKGAPGNGRSCGSCSGHAHDKEAAHPKAADAGRTSAEQARAQKQIAADIQQEASKGRGNVPAELARWADSILAPAKIDWRVKLAQLVRASLSHAAGAVTHNYNRPSRRQAGLGYGPGRPALPALVAPRPRVAVALDTSGSMGTKELADALAEVSGILASVGAPVDFVSGDADAGDLVSASNMAQVKRATSGGGGTDFRPIFDAFNRRKPRIDVLVYLTDGYGPAPELPPRYRVIWALVKGGTAPATWGQVINLD